MGRDNCEKTIKNIKKFHNEKADLFSNKKKGTREKMVVRVFLRCLGISFKECELTENCPEPVDVIFRNHFRFQIMEILDNDRQRGEEYKKFRQKVHNEKNLENLLKPYNPTETLSLKSTIELISKKLFKKSEHYPSIEKSQLDILVYINLKNLHFYDKSPEFPLDELRKQGWRSVSFVWPPYSVILFANKDADDSLTSRVGNILSEWNDYDSFFEI